MIGGRDSTENAFAIPQPNGNPPIQVTGLLDFVTTRAAAYVFLPSVTSIKFIASLGEGQ